MDTGWPHCRRHSLHRPHLCLEKSSCDGSHGDTMWRLWDDIRTFKGSGLRLSLWQDVHGEISVKPWAHGFVLPGFQILRWLLQGTSSWLAAFPTAGYNRGFASLGVHAFLLHFQMWFMTFNDNVSNFKIYSSEIMLLYTHDFYIIAIPCCFFVFLSCRPTARTTSAVEESRLMPGCWTRSLDNMTCRWPPKLKQHDLRYKIAILTRSAGTK